MTPPEHIQSIRTLVERIQQHPPALVRSIVLDDWGRYSNFSVIVQTEARASITKRQIAALFKPGLRHIKGAHIRAIHRNKTRRHGIDRLSFTVDIDFHRYDQQNNTFPACEISA